MIAPLPRSNPYPGPRAYQAGEKLYGRARELAELRNLLTAERLVLLYSPSGAGKSSLIEAALVPELVRRRFRVRPVASVGTPPTEGLPPGTNRYILSVLLALEQDQPPAEQLPLPVLGTLNLAVYLDRRRAAEGIVDEVLVFDQFEEVLTLDPTDLAAKTEFFVGLGEALRDRRRWALFALREDYLAGLDPYREHLPGGLAAGFRLDLLGPAAARLAIQEPARTAKIDFTDTAATKLVDDLRRVHVQQPDGTTVEQLGPWIEPVQLQVVCRRLWERLPPQTTQIEAMDLEVVGDVNSALAGYYSARVIDRVDSFASTKITERQIRDWFDHLITAQGLRGQVLQEPGASQGLDNRVIWSFVDDHLLRAEQRRGVVWFELAHDRLVDPIQESNQTWRAATLDPMQQQAARWESLGQPDSALLTDQAYKDAAAWAKEHPAELTRNEQAFLVASDKARRSRRATRLIRTGSLTLLAFIGFSLLVLYFALDASQQRDLAQAQATVAAQARVRADEQALIAQQQSQLAKSRQLATQAILQIDGQPDLALLLGVEAATITETLEARNSLLSALQRRPYFAAALHSPSSRIQSVAFSPDGRLLAAAGCAQTDLFGACTLGEVRLWNMETRQPFGPSFSPSSPVAATSLAFSPDGTRLAAGFTDESLLVWDVVTRQQQAMLQVDHVRGPFSSVESVAFSPDGRILAAGAVGGTINLWAVPAFQPFGTLGTNQLNIVWGLAFSPDGRILATANQDHTVRLWDVAARQPLTEPLAGPTAGVFSVAFSPDAQYLAAGGCAARDETRRCTSGPVLLWKVGARQAVTLTGHTDAVTGVAFSSDNHTLVSGSADNTLTLWNTATYLPYPFPLTGHTAAVNGVAFSPDGRTLASASTDTTIGLWDLDQRRYFVEPLGDADTGKRAVTFLPDGQHLMVGTASSITLWAGHPPRSGNPLIIAPPALRALSVSANGKILAALQGDTTIWLWDVTTARRIDLLPSASPNRVTALALSADGGILAIASCADPTCGGSIVRLWEVPTGQPHSPVLSGSLPGEISSLIFSPDSKRLAAGVCTVSSLAICREGVVQLWDVGTAREITILRGPRGTVQSVAFSPDSLSLAAASCGARPISGTTCSAGDVRLWNLTDLLAPGFLLRLHKGDVHVVAFSPDGHELASGGEDGVVLWDVTSRQPVGRLLPGAVNAVPPDSLAPEAQNNVSDLSFSPDGSQLAVARYAGPVLLWALPTAAWEQAACAQANRNLTLAEWQQYLGTTSYRRTCSNLPSGDTQENAAPTAVMTPPPGANGSMP